ncbi:MAG: hypothetical protein JNK97_03520 [Zoogloea sp.]|nr:hypothetical protein [Zoogloea sp.]
MRKSFTVSERVAIAAAVEERLHGRHGGDRKADQAGNISGLNDQSDTRDLAAAKAGLGVFFALAFAINDQLAHTQVMPALTRDLERTSSFRVTSSNLQDLALDPCNSGQVVW